MPSFAEHFGCRRNASEPAKPQVDTLHCIIPTEHHAQHEPRNVGRAQRLLSSWVGYHRSIESRHIKGDAIRSTTIMEDLGDEHLMPGKVMLVGNER
jgi:hypothetical protein